MNVILNFNLVVKEEKSTEGVVFVLSNHRPQTTVISLSTQVLIAQ